MLTSFFKNKDKEEIIVPGVVNNPDGKHWAINITKPMFCSELIPEESPEE